MSLNTENRQPSRILSKDQAKAVYGAMCELNNIGGRIVAKFGSIGIREQVDGKVVVYDKKFDKYAHGQEFYANQNEFLKAYGFN